jgi:chromosome segregation ATPase
MSEQDENMHNNEEYVENYEDNENIAEMNLGEEEYEEENMNENGDEEEGQDVYAFDIQINEDSYLLVIGKTDENKLLLRLIDKEDENKPFFQNEFSLDDLRHLNPFFNNIDDENIAFQYIISNLNDSEKVIKILDEEKIKLSISINEEVGKIDISFVLFKTMNDFEGEGEEENQNELLISNNNQGNQHIENDGDVEEGVELMQNLVEGQEGEEQIEEGEIDINNLQRKDEIINKSGNANAILSSNLPLQIGVNQQNLTKSIEKKEISKKNVNGVETIIEKKEITRVSNKNQNEPEIKKEIIITEKKIEPDSQKEIIQSNKESIKKQPQQIQQIQQIENMGQDNNDEIILVKEELLNTMNELNENFNNQLMNQNELFMKMHNELKEDNEKKIKEIKNALNKKDNDLNDMKNKFENLNKKMIDIENNLKENKNIINCYETKINEINNKVDNINEKIKNINNIVNEAIEKNNKKIRFDIDEISRQMNDKMKLRKSIEKEPVKDGNAAKNNYEEIINELATNIQGIENQIGEIRNDLESDKNNNDNNLKIIDEKLNNLEEKLEQNNIAIVNMENENKNKEQNQNNEENINIINDRLNDLENVISEFDSKFQNLDNNLGNLRNSITKKELQNKNTELIQKLGNFENVINNLETKIKNLENNIKNINQKSPSKEQKLDIYSQKIKELENYAKNIEVRINDYEIDNIIQNLSILMEKQNDTEIYDKIKNLETEINEIRDKANSPNVELRKSTDSKNNVELTNKINNIEKEITLFKNIFKKIEDEKLNNNNYKNTNDKRADKLEKRIANVSKQSDDLDIKIDQLFNITKNLENLTKNLDKKTNDIMDNVTKISLSNNNNPDILRNVKKNINLTERIKNNFGYIDNNHMNINSLNTNNGYQIMNNPTQKLNYEIENQYSNTNPNIRNMNNNKDYGESNYPYTVQTQSNHIDSKIVKDNEIKFIINRIRQIHPRINNIYFNLVYRATEDGDKAADFHKKCDKIGPNITLIKTKKGYIFGGFTFKNWEHMPRDIDVNKPNLGSASRDSRAFGFSVSNQKVYNNDKPNEFAIWCNRNFGPTFKNNLFQIFDSCLRKGGYCSIRSNSHFGGQFYDYEISGGESRFRVEELEVYEIKLH